MKNPGTAQTRAVQRLRADRRIALTGTPVENRLSELWSIMHVLNPGLLGTQRAFRERFAVPIERDHDARRDGAAAADHRAVRAASAEDRPDHHRRPARQDRADRALPAHPRAGDAVPGRRRRAAQLSGGRRGHQPPRARARRAHAPQAGVQPSGTLPARRFGARRSIRQARRAPRSCSRRSSPRATRCCASPSSPSGESSRPRTGGGGSASTSVGCTAGSRARNATRWSRPSKRVTVRVSS